MDKALFLKLTPLNEAKSLKLDQIAPLMIKCYWAGMNETNTNGQVPFGMPTRHSACMDTGSFFCNDAPSHDKSTWTYFNMQWSMGFAVRRPPPREAWGWANNVYRGIAIWSRVNGGSLPEGILKVHLGSINGPDLFTAQLRYQLTPRPGVNLGVNLTTSGTRFGAGTIGTS